MVKDRYGRIDTSVAEQVTERGIVKRGNKTGLFAKGTVGGPGRLPSVTEKKYLVGMHSVVSVEDWQNITRRAVADALDGRAAARNWLSKYLLDPILKSTLTKMEVSSEIDDVGQDKKVIKLATVLAALLPEIQTD